MKTNKSFQINIPISKIDEEQRIVTGIATSEALDSQGDIMDYQASKAAFSEWIGNIREMHDPKAIGKAIDVQFDDDNKQVVLSAKISESADGENAWIKVKEGILTGFSIGGRMLEVIKDKSVKGANRVTSYVLSETSLVDNPANPDAMLMMVKSFDGKLQRVEAEVQANDNLPDSWWMEKFMGQKKIKKSVYDASRAISVAVEIAYLLMDESWDENPDADQLAALKTAFDAVRDFAAKEVQENDTYLGEQVEVIELAQKAINLRKDSLMANQIEKTTNVQAGVARDETAAVVEDLTPVPGAEVVDNGVTVPTEGNPPQDEVTVPTEGEDPKTEDPADDVKTKDAPAVAPAETPAEDKGKEKSDSITDLTKSVETLLTKLGDNKEGVELKKAVGDIQKSVDTVAKSVTALEDRVKAIEAQPLPTKAKASYATITKGESEVVTNERAAVEKRQQELIDNPFDAKPGEHEAIARQLRTLPQEEIKE